MRDRQQRVGRDVFDVADRGHGAERQGLDPFGGILVGDQQGQDDDLAGRAEIQAAQRLQARHFRHLSIKEHGVGLELPHILQGHAAVGRGVDDFEIGITVEAEEAAFRIKSEMPKAEPLTGSRARR